MWSLSADDAEAMIDEVDDGGTSQTSPAIAKQALSHGGATLEVTDENLLLKTIGKMKREHRA